MVRLIAGVRMIQIKFREEDVELDAVIVGAGFSGLYALHKLRNELDLNVRAFDKASGVGGTWYWNNYPGARSDSESIVYSYSFDKDLYREWKWTERYPRQKEILGYLNHVADRFDLRRSIEFETGIERAWFNDETHRWDVVTDKGETISARFFICAVGLLSSTNFPAIEGKETFKGEMYHTSQWPKREVELKGKRVGVIGTGSTGVQLITEIAPIAKHLTVFQRTPQYSVPAQHGPVSPERVAAIKADLDGFRRSLRSSLTAFGFQESDVPAMSVTPEQQQAEFQKAWEIGGGFRYLFAFSDIGTDRQANEVAAAFVRKKIAEIVKNPETAKTLTPYDLYAKRPLCDGGYYETFNRENVSLVDVKRHPIARITTKGILTDEGEHELDVLIFATGFDAVTGNFFKIDIRGRNGLKLRDKWSEGPTSYFGVTTAGFPNMFMIVGPVGPFTNQPPAIEIHVEWITETIRRMRAEDIDTIDATPKAEADWMTTCIDQANTTLFTKIDSWINGANVEGKPKTVMFYMEGMRFYVDRLAQMTESDYAGFQMSRSKSDGQAINGSPLSPGGLRDRLSA
jgi:cyclohexanone monooxygenase